MEKVSLLKINGVGRAAVITVSLLTTLFVAVPRVSGDERTLPLKEAVAIALKDNHELKAFGYALSAEGENVGIARSALLPRLSFEERYMRTNNPPASFAAKLNQQRFSQQDFAIDALNNPGPIDDYQTSFLIQQPLFSRKAMLGLDMSRVQREAREREFTRKKQEIVFHVVKTFLSVQTAREHVSAVERGIEDALEHKRIAQLRYDTGLGLYSDVLRTSTALAEAEQKLISANTSLNISRRALGLLLGLSEPVDVSTEPVELPERTLDTHMQLSSSRNDVKAVELYLENARNSVKLTEAGYFPTVSVDGSYQLNDHRQPFGSEGDSWTVQAFLRWEFFDGLKRERERAKAKFQVSRTEEQLAALIKVVSFQVYEAYLGVEETRKNVDLAASALRTSEEGKRLVQIRYNDSLAPIVDLLDAQSNLDRARAAYIVRLNDYRLARAYLSYQSGSLLADLGIEQEKPEGMK